MKAIYPTSGSDSEQIEFLFRELHIKDPIDSVQLLATHGGATNIIKLLFTPSFKAVVRIFGKGTERVIDHEAEQENIQKVNFIQILASFQNAFVTTYQDGKAIDLVLMNRPDVSRLIAIKIGKLHAAAPPIKENQLSKRLNLFLDDLKEEKLYSLAKETEEKVGFLDSKEFHLCHCDLLAGNIVYDGENVGFIDYEYSCYTVKEYDLADHFVEMCGFELDLKNYPSVERQKEFIRNYFHSFKNEEPTEDEVLKILEKVRLLTNVSHLYWACWAYFQHKNSSIDFPYFEYAEWRIKLMSYVLPLPEGHELLRGGPLVDLSPRKKT